MASDWQSARNRKNFRWVHVTPVLSNMQIRSPIPRNRKLLCQCNVFIWRSQHLTNTNDLNASSENLVLVNSSDDKIKTSDALIWKARVENKRCLKVLNLTKNIHACAQLNFTQQFIIPYLTLCHSRLSFCVVFHPKKSLTRWRLGIGSC